MARAGTALMVPIRSPSRRERDGKPDIVAANVDSVGVSVLLGNAMDHSSGFVRN